MFFFSSRRRHTRCLSDWSSDVCSSDLPISARTLTPDTVMPLATLSLGFDQRQLAIGVTEEHADGLGLGVSEEIGRASCREGAWIEGVAARLKDDLNTYCMIFVRWKKHS